VDPTGGQSRRTEGTEADESVRLSAVVGESA
jgi:hypothetical protein